MDMTDKELLELYFKYEIGSGMRNMFWSVWYFFWTCFIIALTWNAGVDFISRWVSIPFFIGLALFFIFYPEKQIHILKKMREEIKRRGLI